VELYQASRQWANRPADERFANLQDMYTACKHYYDIAKTSNFTLQNTQVIAAGEEIMLQGQHAQSRLTHHAFGQIATMVGAPANYLRSLPTDLVAQNLNHGFQHSDDKEKALKGLFHKNGSLICRCVTSQQYCRIWNHEIVERLIPLADDGWNTPPARSSQGSNHSGLYASDHDMFVFLVDGDRRIDDGTEEGLGRGFFCINSEVGQSAFKLITFYYRYVCGNHIVWGAQNVQQVKIIHKGMPAKNWANSLRVELTRYADSSANDDEVKIQQAKRIELGATKEQVLDALFSRKSLGISRKDLDSGYALAEVDYELTKGANPNSVWGMVNGLTRYSQQKEYADERTKLDIAAGKIMEFAF
jgi:hypothetical protein